MPVIVVRQTTYSYKSSTLLSSCTLFLFSCIIHYPMAENINETIYKQTPIKNTETYTEGVKMSTQFPLPSADQQQKTPQTTIKSFFSSLLSLFCCGQFQVDDMETDERVSRAPASRVAASQADNTAETYETLGYLPEDSTSENSCHTSIYNSKEIIPLQQFQRYTITPADKQKFRYRRLLYPARTIYEIEWEDDQWLQLDKRTNIYIEQLRVTGFSKMAIRDDACLKKYISYENPSQMDILLELSITKENRKQGYKQDKDVKRRSRPIKCHQSSYFPIRRTRWWKTSYEVGEARLPNWVDPDLCCNAVMMDAPSVMAAMTNLSRSSACSLQLPKLPDTPTISQNSSVSQLPYEPSSTPTLQTVPWQIKPLKYTDPPVLANPLVNTVA